MSPPANSLPNLINDSLLLLNLITKSGQLLLVRFPVTLHLLLQSFLQVGPGEMRCQLCPLGDKPWIPIYLPQMLNPQIKGDSGSCAQAPSLASFAQQSPWICHKTEWAPEANQPNDAQKVCLCPSTPSHLKPMDFPVRPVRTQLSYYLGDSRQVT